MAEPPIYMDVYDVEGYLLWVDVTTLLLVSIVDIEEVSKWSDRVADSTLDANMTGTERMRNEATIPANPFYDHDGNPVTPEMMMIKLPSGYMYEIGAQLWVIGAYGTIEEWEAKSFGEKCEFIQDYT